MVNNQLKGECDTHIYFLYLIDTQLIIYTRLVRYNITARMLTNNISVITHAITLSVSIVLLRLIDVFFAYLG